MNENEMLNELEKLELELRDERDALHQAVDMRFNLMENMILKFKRKIEKEQGKMGEALSKEA